MRCTMRKADPQQMCLKELCFQAVRRHFAALGIQPLLDLPTPLIKELLPYLTICQLDELQPPLNRRGISTYSGWIGVLDDMFGPKHVVNFHTEEEAKHEVMRKLFTLVFYGFSNHFVKPKRLQPVMTGPVVVQVSRLGLQEIRMMKSLRANAQSWIPCVLRRRRNLEKQTLLWTQQLLCQTFTPCDGPSRACPWGQIHCLEIRECGADSLRVLNRALPTFFCLRSLTLHSFSTLVDLDVLDLARALGKLSESSRSSLTDLSISVLPYTELLEILLDASPKVTSLHVEIQTVMWGPRFLLHHSTTNESELPLQKLTVKVGDLQTDLHFITSVLRRSPHLTSFHVSGMRLPIGSSQSQLLNTLSESNHSLRSLNLEDMKLSDCHPAILNLLRDCRLEELRVNDCRLLERCSNKEESLQQLVCALKTLPSLHTLSLAQNRLAKNVSVLAELFSGGSPSSVRRLDISSNFIQPADLLEFAERLRTHRPPHQLTLDLRKNPGDRDPDTWNAAMQRLSPFCVLLVEGWISTDTMADHISNIAQLPLCLPVQHGNIVFPRTQCE
ncbi:hypothetical protein D5F01_LYC06806 [Larimichthys crocea]|uniref:Leucine-rich repeat-containing protein 41 n=1 Tax=Larimichthys crocea TaxID=215358 RepID=A0A6G0IQR1_LARCR|nr:hypothetical protein D5F01_LYC06806 [Larimichthys crocea]